MKKIRKVVIPVAGMGTRFLPFTKSVAKEMLPIIDKPTIQYIVEEARDSGIEEVIFITSPYKKTIEDHFDMAFELESRLQANNKKNELEILESLKNMPKIYYIRQGEPKGSGHAINLAKGIIGDEPFAVMYGDDLMYSKEGVPALKQLIDLYEKTGANIIGVKEVPKEAASRYGMISYQDIKTRKIETIVEKPKVEDTPSTSAGLGRYIVHASIFEVLKDLKAGVGGEVQFTDAMKELMQKEDFYACEINAKYFDIGNKLEYLKATLEISLDREDLKTGVQEEINKLAK